MPFVLPWIAAAAQIAAVGGTAYSISRAKSAAKKARGQAEYAERLRTEEKATMAKVVKPVKPAKPAKPLVEEPPTIERAEALPKKAKKKAVAIAAGRRRRRATIATGPRGLLEEPSVVRPSLLGA